MRRALALLWCCACAPTVREVPAVTSVRALDLARYSAQGFFMSTEPYAGAHDPVGLILVTQYAAGTYGGTKDIHSPHQWVYTLPRAQDVLDSAYAIALRWGANALVNLEMRLHADTTRPRFEVSGLAIKRK